jgi:tRNA/tmRNA/rRNA uracil-C5-methylase (TrmA/RlmC/RlmD family)
MTTVELTLGAPAAGGGFVARDENGRVIFVRHGISGERVLARLTEEHPKWARAEVTTVLEPSPNRVAPPCPAAGAGKCGGCDYQHIALPEQRVIKAQLLSEQLRRTAKIDIDVSVESVSHDDTGLGTRTRVRFGVDEDGALGMRRTRSHDLVAVDTCLLAIQEIQNLDLGDDVWPLGVDVQVFSLGDDAQPSISFVRSSRDDDSPVDGPEISEDGPSIHYTTVGDLDYQVSSESFWQIHRRAPEVLVSTVLDQLDLKPGDHVLDLYCGAGLFTKAAAVAVGPTGRVTGIDSSSASVEDARVNLSGQLWANVVDAQVSGESVAPYLDEITAVVLDPPRNGCDRDALIELCGVNTVTRIVSVSCDAATFARDTRILLDHGWTLTSLRVFDLFEMTEHMECVGTFTR